MLRKILLPCVAVTLLGSCASLLPKGAPAPRLYTLNAPRYGAADKMAPLPFSLKINKPQTAPGLDTERMAVHLTANQLDYYADAKWATDSGALMQAVLTEGFDASHAFAGVSNDLTNLKADYTILNDLQDFQVDRKNGQTQAHMRLTAKLVRAGDEIVLATFRYAEFAPVEGDNMQSVAAGFDQVQQTIVRKLIADTIHVLQTQPMPMQPVDAGRL